MLWHDTYLTELTTDELVELLARDLGLVFGRRDSYYSGIYYRYQDDDLEVTVNANRYEDGELVYPGLPDSTFLKISGRTERPLRQRLRALPILTLHQSTEV